MQDAIHVRLDEHARRLGELERTQPAVVASEVRGIQHDLEDLRDEMRALRRALYGVALSVAGGAVIFAFTAFQIWGGP